MSDAARRNFAVYVEMTEAGNTDLAGFFLEQAWALCRDTTLSLLLSLRAAK